MAYHHLMLKWHLMAGCDQHTELTATWPPLPAPGTWHLVGQRLEGFGGASMTGSDVLANGWNIIHRDSDIMYGIPHIPLPPFPPCVLAPLWTLLSGSKSYFGPSNVLANGKPVAAALLVHLNPQLNCDEPLPLPTGVAVTWSTVVVSMSLGDILGGFLSMGFDMAISWVLNKAGGRIAGRVGSRVTSRAGTAAIGAVTGAVFQQITGSPVGYTYSVPAHLFGDEFSPGNWGIMLGHPLGEWLGDDTPLGAIATPLLATSPIGRLIVDDPGVEEF